MSPGVGARYLLAHTGKSLMWTGSDLLTLWVLVGLFQVDPAKAGAVFLAGLAANALADGAVGVWIDKYPRHTVWVAGVGLAIATLSFPATMLLSRQGDWALLTATLIFRVGYAAYDVPHNTLMSRLASTPKSALRLSRGRTIGSGIAALIVALGVKTWLAGPTATDAVLWGIALAAAVTALAVLPLFNTIGIETAHPERTEVRGPGLPVAFLAASVVGIVALGSVAKGVMHLPPDWRAPTPGDMALLLTLGRLISAGTPLIFANAKRGLARLSLIYVVAAGLAVAVALGATQAIAIVALGLILGVSNLLGWALLPLLARSARGYGLYTMMSKLALGFAGLAMTMALGSIPVFTRAGFAWLGLGAAVACGIAAILLALSARLTFAAPRG